MVLCIVSNVSSHESGKQLVPRSRHTLSTRVGLPRVFRTQGLSLMGKGGSVSAETFDTPKLFEGAGKPVAVGRISNRVVVGCQMPGWRSPLEGDVVFQVRVWDLEAHKPLGPWIADDLGFEKAAIGEFGGKPVIACGGKGGDVRVWDATTGRPLGSLDVDEPWIRALAVRELNGTLVLVASGYSVQAWDIGSREPLTPRFGNWDGYPYAVAAGDLHGDPVIAVVDDKDICIWSLAKRELVCKLPPLPGEPMALALSEFRGRPALISISKEEGEEYQGRWVKSNSYSVVRVWDLAAKPVLSGKLAVPIIGANGVAAGQVSGQHVIVSTFSTYAGSYEGEVCVWRPSI